MSSDIDSTKVYGEANVSMEYGGEDNEEQK